MGASAHTGTADTTATLALAGDTMLGRGVADALTADRATRLVAPGVAAHIASADAAILNLECCISDRGERFPDPRKPFFFRAPPVAAQRLAELGVDAVTLANNHALDYGPVALLDTLRHLDDAGIAVAGAGADDAVARESLSLSCGPLRLRLVAFSDHPAAYAADSARPGIAYTDLDPGLPERVRGPVRPGPDCDAVLVTPHWGPNMVAEPTRRVRSAADALVAAGATLVAGHSAHVFHGVAGRVLFDLGDFIDDYAVDRRLRNDLGLLWLVELSPDGPTRIRAVPLALEYCFTRLASAAEADWIERRLRALCAPFGTSVERADELIEVRPAADPERQAPPG
jgi:poly-gamma-glutamate capsule biosynthesis protein CapA/YwtB (metallophosphatase superfamily)